MSTSLEQELAMYRKVQTLYTSNSSVLSALPGWAGFWQPFETGIGLLDAALLKLAVPNGTPGKNKKTKRFAMEADANLMHVALNALALVKDNTALAGQMAFAASDVRNATDLAAVNYCQLLHDSANSNKTNLAAPGFNITPAQIAALQTKIDDFKASQPVPKLTQEAQVALNATVEPMVTAQKKYLISLDVLAALLAATSNNNLFVLWQAARKKDATAVQHANLHGQTKNNTTKEAVPHAKVYFVELDKTFVSGDKGQYSTGHLEEGYYTVNATAPGYQPLSVHVSIVHGQATKMDFLMVHL